MRQGEWEKVCVVVKSQITRHENKKLKKPWPNFQKSSDKFRSLVDGKKKVREG